MQALSPRQAMLIPRQVVLIPRQAGSPSLEGEQAMQALAPRQAVLLPRQAVLVPQLGRNAVSAGTQSQAGSGSPTQLGRSKGNAGAHSQAGRVSPQKEGVQAAQALLHRQATNSPGIVQPMQTFIPRQAALNLSPMPGRSAGSADTLPQTDQSLSPSHSASGATAGDATSLLDNTSITKERGQRPGGQVPWLPKPGQPNLYLLRVPPSVMGKTP